MFFSGFTLLCGGKLKNTGKIYRTFKRKVRWILEKFFSWRID
ncbi:hypothetical protein SC1083_2103 [Aggregatibacter actinomycetemcomitans serotype e str. SC1083]|uniref:Uncharacterized protein n=1 Tax=Aggregatibacter actinomycetemcomitans serotype e str. SC1083 TaxID=907488 RepID=G4AB68_AGGAC|nr:hypothetical protein CF65_01041 [Aggregatibacter actinomycetemcomitans HK1651]EGY32409.1 hypothetical protein SC1083_2103 [Aggregatibacter actinomycetemcomitans serotype e str. SC1083]